MSSAVVAVAGEEKQVAQQAVLIANNELFEKASLLAFEPNGDG
ncbi:MAG: hypothetical protein WDM87_08370 [Terracidiphilus sp.]